MTVLVMTDLTTGTGRFNLARGAVGTCTGIAAALSTTATGVIAAGFGRPASFLTAATVAALAVLLLWLYLPESRPKEYLDQNQDCKERPLSAQVRRLDGVCRRTAVH